MDETNSHVEAACPYFLFESASKPEIAATTKLSSNADADNQDESMVHEFTLFPNLAVELRLKIWKFALPGPRSIKIRRVKTDESAYSKQNFRITGMNEVPALLRTCHESRTEALRFYKRMFGSVDGRPQYFDPSIDTLILFSCPWRHPKLTRLLRDFVITEYLVVGRGSRSKPSNHFKSLFLAFPSLKILVVQIPPVPQFQLSKTQPSRPIQVARIFQAVQPIQPVQSMDLTQYVPQHGTNVNDPRFQQILQHSQLPVILQNLRTILRNPQAVPPDHLDAFNLLLMAVNAATLEAMLAGAKQAAKKITPFREAFGRPKFVRPFIIFQDGEFDQFDWL